MQSLGRMQEKRRRARAGKGGGDLSSDKAGFAHATDNHSAFACKQHVNSFDKAGVQPGKHILNGLCLDLEHTAGCLQTHRLLTCAGTCEGAGEGQRRTNAANSFSRDSKPASCERGKAFAPSESAADGLSCVSRKMPSTPAATPARAKGSMN